MTVAAEDGLTSDLIEAETLAQRDIAAWAAGVYRGEQEAAAAAAAARARAARAAAAARSTVQRAPAPAPVVDPGSIQGIVVAAANEFGIDARRFLAVIKCESRFNPGAVSPISGALGLGQHLPRYWPGRAAALGYSQDRWSDPVANARVSAKLIREGGWGHYAQCL